jgi:hypothetical protein
MTGVLYYPHSTYQGIGVQRNDFTQRQNCDMASCRPAPEPGAFSLLSPTPSGSGVGLPWVQCPVLPLTSHVTLGKWLLCALGFLHL